MVKRSFDVLNEVNTLPESPIRRICVKPNCDDMYKSIIGSKSKLPNCVIHQVLNPKNVVYDILPGRQKNQLPVVAFFFKPNDTKWLDFCDSLNMMHSNILIIGVTPSIKGIQIYNFPIIVDHNGEICQRMNLRDPLGGGIYPLSSFVIFNKFGFEVARFKIGYDKNIIENIYQIVNYIKPFL